jgi:hypothetical protein
LYVLLVSTCPNGHFVADVNKFVVTKVIMLHV